MIMPLENEAESSGE